MSTTLPPGMGWDVHVHGMCMLRRVMCAYCVCMIKQTGLDQANQSLTQTFFGPCSLRLRMLHLREETSVYNTFHYQKHIIPKRMQDDVHSTFK